MKCLRPRKVYDGKSGEASEYPCGKCMACRRARTREWANRITHEITYWDDAVFITLTYDNDHYKNELCKRDVQLFIKRLRKSIEPRKIKYYGCGEYGEKFGRPHYHIIIFGLSIKDDCFKLIRSGKSKNYYACESWDYGYIDIGNVTYKSAAYVAGYVQKKHNQTA